MNWPQATAKRPHGMVVNESEKLNVLAAKIAVDETELKVSRSGANSPD